MRVIVVGGGKVGYYLAKTLMEHGHDARLVEQDKELCRRLANELDAAVICGDGTTSEALLEAGVEKADALIGATGQDQNNLVACQLAKIRFHVRKTIAKVNNPKNVAVLRSLGVDIPISSTNNIAYLLEKEVDAAAIKQLVSFNAGEASLFEVELPSPYKYSGKTLQELQMPQEWVLVSITRNGQFIIPRGNTKIYDRDKLVVVCKNTALHDFQMFMRLENVL